MEPTGRARVSTTNPRAFAVCDRCGCWQNHDRLSFQYEWTGTRLYNTRILVCPRCLDVPFQQLRTIVLPPDPVAILDARTEQFAVDEAGPTSSAIAVAAAQGATVISVQSVTGFSVSQTVQVQMINAAFATETIMSIDPIANTLTVSIPLPAAAPLGGLVSA